MPTDPTIKKSGQTSGTTPASKPVKNPKHSFAEVLSLKNELLGKLGAVRLEETTLRGQSDAAFAKADAYRAKGDGTLAAVAVSSSTGKAEEDKKQLLDEQRQSANKIFSSLMAFAEARLQNVIGESKFLASLDASSKVSDYEREIGGLEKQKTEVLVNEKLGELG